MLFLQLKITFVITLNSQAHTDEPYNSCIKPPKLPVLQQTEQPQQNATQWSSHDVDQSVVVPTKLCSMLSFSQTLNLSLRLALLRF